jgi:hypothetical protein
MHRAAAGVSSCEARAAGTHQLLPAESLENWEPVSDRAVLIWTKHSARAYLVSVDRRLQGLTAAPIIDLVDGDHDRRISACGHDGITIGDGADDRSHRVDRAALRQAHRGARSGHAVDAAGLSPGVSASGPNGQLVPDAVHAGSGPRDLLCLIVLGP